MHVHQHGSHQVLTRLFGNFDMAAETA